MEEAARLSAQVGNQVLLKREDLQAVFSFKLRGAYNKMAGLSPTQRARGVVCSSAGNHAQGVALAAKRLVGLWCSCRACSALALPAPGTGLWLVAELPVELLCLVHSRLLGPQCLLCSLTHVERRHLQ